MVKSKSERPVVFFLNPEELADKTLRMDLHYYHPKYRKTIELIENARAHYSVKQLDEVTEVTRMLGFEEDRFVKYVDHGIPFLQVHNIKEFEIDLTDVKYILIDAHQKLKRSQLRPNDVVITITGRVGTAAVVPSTIGECNLSKENARIRVQREEISSNYVAVYLNSRLGRTLLERWYSGSTRSRTLIKNLRKIPIIIPTKETQTRIVNKVMSLKQRRKKKFLEAKSYSKRAQRILGDGYKSIHKILGIKPQPPNDNKVFTLAKDELDDRIDVGFYSEKKKYNLQSNFPIKKIGEIVEFSRETVVPQKEPLKEFRYIQIRDVDPEYGRITSYTEMSGKCAPSRARLVIHKGDIITAMSGSATGTPRHSTAIVTEGFDGYVATTGFGVLKPRKNVDLFFVYFMLRGSYVLDEIKRRLAGATIPAITKSEFKRIKIPVPPLHVQKEIVNILKKATDKSNKYKLRARNLVKRAEEIDLKAEKEIRKALSIETK